MEELINFSNVIRLNNNNTSKKLLEYKNIYKQTQSQIIECNKLYDNGNKLTRNQLIEYCHNFGDMYRLAAQKKNSNYFDEYSDEDNQGTEYMNEFELGSTDDGLAYKNEYLHCVNLILSFNIDVHKVTHNPKFYFKRKCSSLILDKPCFMFECQKGNYCFRIDFLDDCDCEPGLLVAHDLTHKITNEKINNYCDLYIQNTSQGKLDKFLIIINEYNVEQFINKKFSTIFNKCQTISIFFDMIIKNNLNIDNLDLNESNFNYYLLSKDENWILLPYHSSLKVFNLFELKENARIKNKNKEQYPWYININLADIISENKIYGIYPYNCENEICDWLKMNTDDLCNLLINKMATDQNAKICQIISWIKDIESKISINNELPTEESVIIKEKNYYNQRYIELSKELIPKGIHIRIKPNINQSLRYSSGKRELVLLKNEIYMQDVYDVNIIEDPNNLWRLTIACSYKEITKGKTGNSCANTSQNNLFASPNKYEIVGPFELVFQKAQYFVNTICF